MKLAVLVSGMWRNFEKTWPRSEEVLRESGVKFQVFLSTFNKNPNLDTVITPDNIGNRFFWGTMPKQFKEFGIAEINNDVIMETVHNCTYDIRNYDENDITNRFRVARGKNRKAQINSISMYLGIQGAYSLFNNSPDKGSFTHFLRLRTDFQLKPAKIWSEVLSSDFFIIGPTLSYGALRVGDQCYGGKVQLAETLLDFEEYLLSLVNEGSWQERKENLMLGESVLAGRISASNLNMEASFFPRLGVLVRPKMCTNRKETNLRIIESAFKHNQNVLKHRIKQLLRVKRLLEERSVKLMDWEKNRKRTK